MKTQNFVSLREATIYGSRLEQVLREEKQHERQYKPVQTRAATTDCEKSEILKVVERLSKEVANLQNKQPQGSNNGAQGSSSSRGNPRAGQQGSGRQGRNPSNRPCLLCNEYGHWCRDCPLVITNIPEYQQAGADKQSAQPLN